jgi:hypothetical protein
LSESVRSSVTGKSSFCDEHYTGKLSLNPSKLELNDNDLNDDEVSRLVSMPQLLTLKLVNNKVAKLDTIDKLVRRSLTFSQVSPCSAILTFPETL